MLIDVDMTFCSDMNAIGRAVVTSDKIVEALIDFEGLHVLAAGALVVQDFRQVFPDDVFMRCRILVSTPGYDQ